MIRDVAIGSIIAALVWACGDDPMQALGSADDGDPSDDGAGEACGNGEVDEGEACDDANDNNLDGCTSACRPGPRTVVAVGDAVTDVVGDPGSDPRFDDACGVASAITAIHGEVVDGGLANVGIACRPLALVDAESPGLTTGEPVDLRPARGATGGVAFERACDPGGVVVGFEARTDGAGVVQLVVRCAALDLQTGDAGWVVATGEASALTPAGGELGDPTPLAACDPGWVATASRIHAGDRVFAFGLGCSEIVVQ